MSREGKGKEEEGLSREGKGKEEEDEEEDKEEDKEEEERLDARARCGGALCKRSLRIAVLLC